MVLYITTLSVKSISFSSYIKFGYFRFNSDNSSDYDTLSGYELNEFIYIRNHFNRSKSKYKKQKVDPTNKGDPRPPNSGFSLSYFPLASPQQNILNPSVTF